MTQSAGVVRINDIKQYVRAALGPHQSPIDLFYLAAQEIFQVGSVQFIAANPSMGGLLLAGLVSVTENYFRDVFGRIIRLCPIAKAASADENVRLGSVVWHGGGDAERGAFEQTSFASAKNIVEVSRKFVDHQLTKTSVFEEYDKVCELRHGIVHSSAFLAGKNAVKLHLASTGRPLKIHIGYPELQECGSICTSLVVSVNMELFSLMARRWAEKWPKEPSWRPTDRHRLFREVWETFHSQRDETSGAIPTPLTLMKCRNAVAAEFP